MKAWTPAPSRWSSAADSWPGQNCESLDIPADLDEPLHIVEISDPSDGDPGT